jgi:hypothetical protein
MRGKEKEFNIITKLDVEIRKEPITEKALIKLIESFIKDSTGFERNLFKGYHPAYFSGPDLKEAVHAFMLETPAAKICECERIMTALNIMVAATEQEIDESEVKEYVQDCVDECLAQRKANPEFFEQEELPEPPEQVEPVHEYVAP